MLQYLWVRPSVRLAPFRSEADNTRRLSYCQVSFPAPRTRRSAVRGAIYISRVRQRSPLSRLPAPAVALALFSCAAPAPVQVAAAAPETSLVLVSLDTVRADHLELYGYSRPTMPRLAELARRSWVFRNAYSQETNTLPSHATMLTGLYPPQHGAIDNAVPLPAGTRTLAQILRDEGWATGAFVSGWPLKSRVSAIERGFDVYDEAFDGNRRPGNLTTQRALQWWRQSEGRRRFLLLHLYDAHGPYEPSLRLAQEFRSPSPGPRVKRLPHYQLTRSPFGDRKMRVGAQEYIDAYDAMIRALDELLADLLKEIDLERTVVVVVADHGESLDERVNKFGHGLDVYDEQTHVPLVISAPGFAARSIDDLVETIDLFPTMLRLVGHQARVAPATAGHDLVEVVSRRAARPGHAFSSARPRTSRTTDRRFRLDESRRILAVRTESKKLVLYPGRKQDHFELFDLTTDPGERAPLAFAPGTARADDSLRLLLRYAALAARAPRSAPAELSDGDSEMLRSLGYLD